MLSRWAAKYAGSRSIEYGHVTSLESLFVSWWSGSMSAHVPTSMGMQLLLNHSPTLLSPPNEIMKTGLSRCFICLDGCPFPFRCVLGYQVQRSCLWPFAGALILNHSPTLLSPPNEIMETWLLGNFEVLANSSGSYCNDLFQVGTGGVESEFQIVLFPGV